MAIHEVRNSDAARQLLLQGLWLQRVVPVTARFVRPALGWALEMLSGDEPLPPIGFVADAGHLVFGTDAHEPAPGERVELAGLPAATVRGYEDYVLGKLYADTTFERGADAVAHYPGERDRSRGLSFLLSRIRERSGCEGVVMSPAVVKTALIDDPEKLLAEGWDSLTRDGLEPLLGQLYDEIIAAFRSTGDVLGPEDVFELEHGTALAQFGQRLALRQVLQAAALLEEGLPHHPPRALARRRDVPTHIRDEDMYPVGGFASISKSGSIESLLHSQLVYMEPDERARPDLFDVKFLRDELFYYSRDENEFLRRRRTFVVALFPDLAEARVKDAGLPWQRIVLLLGLLVSAVRRLLAWLSDEALLFELVLIEPETGRTPPSNQKGSGVVFRGGEKRKSPQVSPPATKKDSRPSPLADERELLEMLFREQIAAGTVRVDSLPARDLERRGTGHARRSLCQCLVFSTKRRHVAPDNVSVLELTARGPVPQLSVDGARIDLEDDEPISIWRQILGLVLEHSL